MRVLMVTPRYPPNVHGGGEISCSLLVKELGKHIDIDVFSFDGNILSPGDEKIERVNIGGFKNKVINNILAYNVLKNKINHYDIFHTYNLDFMPVVGLLTKKFPIKSVGTLNGIVYSNSMSTFKFKFLSYRYYRNELLMKYIKQITFYNAYSTTTPRQI